MMTDVKQTVPWPSFLTLLLYLVGLLVALECSTRLALSSDLVFSRLRGNNDYTWRKAWLERHSSDKEIWYEFDRYDSTKGWFTKPNLRNKQVFDNRVLNTNSKGLRGTTEYPYTKQPGRTRIVVLGDSFTFGDGVSDDETYAHVLQQRLPQTEVINMGIHGYAHDQMLILLKEEGVQYRPDIILLGFISVDIRRNMLSFRDFAKPRYSLKGGQLTQSHIQVPSPSSVISNEWKRIRLLELWSLLRQKVYWKLGVYEKETQKVTIALLAEIAGTAKSIGAQPVFAYIPFGNEITNPNIAEEYEKFLFELCDSDEGLECLSLKSHFEKKTEDGMVFEMGHWDSQGHQVIGEYLAAKFLENGYVR